MDRRDDLLLSGGFRNKCLFQLANSPYSVLLFFIFCHVVSFVGFVYFFFCAEDLKFAVRSWQVSCGCCMDTSELNA